MVFRTRAKNTLLAGIIMLALLVPAYSQQDVDPTWYPWVSPNPVVAQHPQPKAANLANQRKSRSASPAGRKRKRQARQQAHSDCPREIVTRCSRLSGLSH
jgi:hypothetical protein